MTSRVRSWATSLASARTGAAHRTTSVVGAVRQSGPRDDDDHRRAAHPTGSLGHAAPGPGAVAGVPRRPARHAAAGLRRHGGARAGAHRGPADDRQRPDGARRAGPHPGARGRAARRGRHRPDGVRGLPAQRPPVPHHRDRPGHPAGARLPPRARPVGADPERRAARVAGVPGDQRRRHDLHVHAVGRPADDRQLRPAPGGDRR